MLSQADPDHTARPAAPVSTADATRKMLARLWQKNEPLFRERLRTLSAASVAAREGRLSSDQREEAAGEAHKLVGSLGMFGYPQGSVLARTAEDMLNAEGPLDGARLGSLVAEMHRVLPL